MTNCGSCASYSARRPSATSWFWPAVRQAAEGRVLFASPGAPRRVPLSDRPFFIAVYRSAIGDGQERAQLRARPAVPGAGWGSAPATGDRARSGDGQGGVFLVPGSPAIEGSQQRAGVRGQ
jgi:hypothetical protein